MRAKLSILIGLLVATGGGVALFKGIQQGKPDRVLIRPGQEFSLYRKEIRSIDNASVKSNGKWLLVVYSESGNQDGIRHARYADILWRKYSRHNLMVIGAMPASSEVLMRIAQENLLSYPLVRDDGPWSKALGIGKARYALVLVDPTGSVEFASATATSEDMRQLVEKHVTGTITYRSRGKNRALSVGQLLSDAPIVNIKTMKAQSLASLGPGQLMLFSPTCADCSLRHHIAAYMKVPPALRPRRLIFTSQFTIQELRDTPAAREPDTDIYVASDPIPGVENQDTSESLLSNEVVVARIDDLGKILAIIPWETFSRGVQHAK